MRWNLIYNNNTPLNINISVAGHNLKIYKNLCFFYLLKTVYLTIITCNERLNLNWAFQYQFLSFP